MTDQLRIGLAAAALAAALDASAQTPGDPTVVVTATRTPQAAANLVTDVSVVGAQRLRGAAQGSLADQLDLEPGVETAANGGPGSTTSVFLRGANAGQTLTLIEGFRIGSATLGSTSFEGLPATRFGRAEVLRGPASGLYGADAIGGVVQLFLPRGVGPAAGFADAGIGTWGTRAANAGVRGQSGAFDYAVSVGHARSDGFSATKPGSLSYHPDRDGYERTNASANLNLALAPGHELGLVLFADRLSSDFDDGPGFADALNRQRSQLVGVRSTHALTDALRLNLRAGDTLDRYESVSSFPGAFRTRQRQLAADTQWLLGPATLLGVGYERLEQKVHSASFDPGAPGERTTDALRASLFVNAAPHIVQASLRHDDSSQYGGRTTGSLAYGFRLTPQLRVGAGASNGFRAPSFNDLYFPNYGRAGVRPETARNAELGLYWDGEAASARAVVYRNRVRDLIVFAPACPDASPQFRSGCADNVNRARLEGVSLAWSQQLGAVTRVRAALDFQRPTDETLERRLPRRAGRHAAFAVEQTIGQAVVGVEWLLSGERYDDARNTRRLGGYGVLNLRAEAPITRALSVFARANNVFDKDYETARLFATPGANVFVGLRYASR